MENFSIDKSKVTPEAAEANPASANVVAPPKQKGWTKAMGVCLAVFGAAAIAPAQRIVASVYDPVLRGYVHAVDMGRYTTFPEANAVALGMEGRCGCHEAQPGSTWSPEAQWEPRANN